MQKPIYTNHWCFMLQANGMSDDNQPKNTRVSLSDLSNTDDVEALTVRQLKEILARNFVSYSGCCEKWELVERVIRLFKETEENRKFCKFACNMFSELC